MLKRKLTVLSAIAVLLVFSAAFSCNTSSPYGKAIKVGLAITDTIPTGAATLDKLRLNGPMSLRSGQSSVI